MCTASNVKLPPPTSQLESKNNLLKPSFPASEAPRISSQNLSPQTQKCNKSTKMRKFTHKWTIENFDKVQDAEDDQLLSVMHSEPFSWSPNAEMKFSLRLVPKFTIDHEDFVPVYLYLEENASQNQDDIRINYKISILDSAGNATNCKGISSKSTILS